MKRLIHKIYRKSNYIRIHDRIIKEIVRHPELGRFNYMSLSDFVEIKTRAEHSTDPKLLAALALFYYFAENHSKAQQYYRRVIEINEGYVEETMGLPNIYLWESLYAFSQHDLEYGITNLERCLKIYPSFDVGWILLLLGLLAHNELQAMYSPTTKIKVPHIFDLAENAIHYADSPGVKNFFTYQELRRSTYLCLFAAVKDYKTQVEGILSEIDIPKHYRKKIIEILPKVINARDYFGKNYNYNYDIDVPIPENIKLPDSSLFNKSLEVTIGHKVIALSGREFNVFGLLAIELLNDAKACKIDSNCGWIGRDEYSKVDFLRNQKKEKEDSLTQIECPNAVSKIDCANEVSEVVGNIRKKLEKAQLVQKDKELIETNTQGYRLSNNPLKVAIS